MGEGLILKTEQSVFEFPNKRRGGNRTLSLKTVMLAMWGRVWYD